MILYLKVQQSHQYLDNLQYPAIYQYQASLRKAHILDWHLCLHFLDSFHSNYCKWLRHCWVHTQIFLQWIYHEFQSKNVLQHFFGKRSYCNIFLLRFWLKQFPTLIDTKLLCLQMGLLSNMYQIHLVITYNPIIIRYVNGFRMTDITISNKCLVNYRKKTHLQNKWFAHNFKFQRNTSKFAIFKLKATFGVSF